MVEVKWEVEWRRSAVAALASAAEQGNAADRDQLGFHPQELDACCGVSRSADCRRSAAGLNQAVLEWLSRGRAAPAAVGWRCGAAVARVATCVVPRRSGRAPGLAASSLWRVAWYSESAGALERRRGGARRSRGVRRPRTTACTRPESARVSSVSLKASAVVCGPGDAGR